MPIVGPSWETLSYGRTCVGREQLELPPPKRSLARVAFPIALIGMAATFCSTSLGVASSGATFQVSYHLGKAERASPDDERIGQLGQEFKRARLDLGLTRDEAAKFLHISESSIVKLESGDVQEPFPPQLEKYQVLLEIARVLKRAYKSASKYARGAVLRTELSVFDNHTALEHAFGDEEGYLDVLGVIKKRFE